tara:strand:- start:554 stop:748 length:195 start_codon:yes stop_codon:yes gene_type:complete
MNDKIIGWSLIGVIVGGLISALFYIKGVEDAAYVIGFVVLDLLISVILTYAIILILDAKQKGQG